MARWREDEESGGGVSSNPNSGGGVKVIGTKYLTIEWSHTEVLPITMLKGFRVVVFTGTDPNNTDNHLIKPIEVGPTERKIVATLKLSSQKTVYSAIQAIYHNGNESSWRVLSGSTVIDPDTVQIAKQSGLDTINLLFDAGAKKIITFEEFNSTDWDFNTGNASMVTLMTSGGSTGGKVLRCTGMVWVNHKRNIPFDPNKLYRIRVRYRQITDPSSGGKNFYGIMNGITENGTTPCNISGGSDFSDQHYGPLAVSNTAGDGWHEYVYYWKGTAATGTVGNIDPTTPGKMHANTRYVRPGFIINYNAGNGVAEVDFIEIAEATDDLGVKQSTTALSMLTDISNDDLLTPGEKPPVIAERDRILSEQTALTALATAYGLTSDTTKTTYDAKVTALTNYLATLTSPVLWSTLTGNTTIVGADFRTKFKDVYDAGESFRNAVSNKAKTLADGAQGSANTALARGNGINLLRNSDFGLGYPGDGKLQAITGWSSISSSGGMTPVTAGYHGVNLSTYYPGAPTVDPVLTSANTVWWNTLSNYSIGKYNESYSEYMPAQAGKRYCASIYAGNHRGQCGIYVFFYDAAGVNLGYLGDTGASWIDSATEGYVSASQQLSNFKRIYAIGTAPAGTAYCRIILRMWGYKSGVDAYAFWCRPMFEETALEATGPSPWSASSTNLATISDRIASDSWLTRGEKAHVLKEYDSLWGDYADLVSKAASAGVSSTAFTTAATALDNYLPTLSPGWSDLTRDTPIDPTTWKSKWATAYAEKDKLKNAITAAAQADADTALADLTRIGSDSWLSKGEKPQVQREWTTLNQEYNNLTAKATAAGVSSTSYTNAFSALATYLGTLSPDIWTAADSAIDATQWKDKWALVYSERTILQNAIAMSVYSGVRRICGGNLAIDGSFERLLAGDYSASPYGLYNNGANSGVTFARDDVSNGYVGGRFGNSSARVMWTSQATLSIGILGSFNRLGWSPNKTYCLSWWAIGSGSAVGCTFILGWNVDPATVEWIENPALTASGWQRYRARITWGASVEASGNGFITLAEVPRTSAGRIHFDGLMVQEGDIPTEFDYSAGDALDDLSKIASDGWLSRGEKPGIVREWQAIDLADDDLIAKAQAAGVSYSAFSTAFTNLSNYLVSLSPAWDDATKDTPINSTSWNTHWKTIYSEITKLQNAISEAARTRAITAETNAKDYAKLRKQKNLLINPYFEKDMTGWEVTARQNGSMGFVSGPRTDCLLGDYMFRGDGSYELRSSELIPWDPAKPLWLGIYADQWAGTTPGVWYLGIRCFDGNKAYIGGGGYQYSSAMAGVLPSATWQGSIYRGTGAAGTYDKFVTGTKFIQPVVIINYNGSADVQSLVYAIEAIPIEEHVIADFITVGALRTFNYTEDGNGYPTAGAKIDTQGTAFKVAAGNFQIGSRVFTDYWFRLLQGIDGSNSTGIVIWRGNNDTTTLGGAPNIDCFDIYDDGWFYVDTNYNNCQFNWRLQPSALTDNLDSMRMARVKMFPAAGGANPITTFYMPLVDRLYANTTHSNSANASHGTFRWSNRFSASAGTYWASVSPYFFCGHLLIAISNVYGWSDEKWFHSSTTAQTYYTRNTTAPTGAPSGGGGGGGGGVGGGCPAPWMKVMLASGMLVEARDLYDGAKVVGVNDSTFEPATGTVRSPRIIFSERIALKLSNGKTVGFSKDHRLGVVDRGWVRVCDLKKGDLLIAQEPLSVVELKPEGIAEVVTFEVQGCATYFVENILSHNIKMLN